MTERLTLEDFPVRPRINVGESLAGYCWRIYEENGHRPCDQIRMALKDVHFGDESREVLAHFLGEDIFSKLKATQRAAVERWNAYTGPKWFSLARTPRICPTCIRQNGFHAMHWDFPLMKACAVHGTVLVQRCHGCLGLFNWGNIGRGWICRCGANACFAPAAPASKAWVNLARLVAAAIDSPVSVAGERKVSCALFGVASYRIRDVYEMLWWLQRMRQSLTAQSPGARHVAAKIAAQSGARAVPDEWEIKHLECQLDAVVPKVRRALRWFFRDDPSMLVDHDRAVSIQRFYDVVNALKQSSSAAAAALHNMVANALAAYSSHIDSAPRVCFHPRLDAAGRQKSLQAFLTWWPSFALEVSSLRQTDALRRQFGEKTQSYTDGAEGDGDFAAGLLFLNLLFEVANKQYPSAALASVRKRWHLPSELRQPLDELSSIGLYVLHLHKSELAFVLLLIADSMDRWLQTNSDLS